MSEYVSEEEPNYWPLKDSDLATLRDLCARLGLSDEATVELLKTVSDIADDCFDRGLELGGSDI